MAKYFLEYMTLEMVSEGEKMQRDSGKIWNWLSTDASTTNKKQQQWIDNPSLKKKQPYFTNPFILIYFLHFKRIKRSDRTFLNTINTGVFRT